MGEKGGTAGPHWKLLQRGRAGRNGRIWSSDRALEEWQGETNNDAPAELIFLCLQLDANLPMTIIHG